MHFYYFLFGVFSFTFIYSFADFLLPWAFGLNYAGAGHATKLMFLTILIFPTAFLQANVLIAMKCERLDMWFNVACLATNLIFCFLGIYFHKSLSIIIISIFFGFLVFRILQDIFLIKKQISSKKHAFEFYMLSSLFITGYFLLAKLLNPLALFAGFWLIIIVLYLLIKKPSVLFANKMIIKRLRLIFSEKIDSNEIDS